MTEGRGHLLVSGLLSPQKTVLASLYDDDMALSLFKILDLLDFDCAAY
jgi:hypothetical protein